VISENKLIIIWNILDPVFFGSMLCALPRKQVLKRKMRNPTKDF
jgi:hypothetical protein